MSIASNKRAWFDYFILEKFEAGIELKGTEVKSVKTGKISIQESHVRVMKNEIFILNMFISAYEFGNRYNVDERRTRKLLMHRKEIKRLIGKVSQEGLTLIPLNIYLKRNLIKVEVALAKGKKQYDKRDEMAKKDSQRDVERAVKEMHR